MKVIKFIGYFILAQFLLVGSIVTAFLLAQFALPAKILDHIDGK
jgi:hypothetical protein